MSCIFCESELHGFCERPEIDENSGRCCCETESTMIQIESSPLNINPTPSPVAHVPVSIVKRPVGRPRKPREEVSRPVDAGVGEIVPEPEHINLSATHDNTNDSPKANNLQGKWKKLGAPMKAGADMNNVLATGRARAKIVKPIVPGETICEWKGLRYAGGGIIPIIGCDGNGAESVHHGPDKSVLRNEPNNLHRVCQTCHERWHICNDAYYGDMRPENGESWLPSSDLHCHQHQATIMATDEAVKFYESMWRKIRDASRHSRHEEADMYRESLISFMSDGLELII